MNADILASQVLARCGELAAFTETPGFLTRTFLSPPMRDCHRLLSSWMRTLEMTVTIDAMGNLRALWGKPDAPRLLLGSHLDTVPNAGAFDGPLGVLLALAVVESIGLTHLPFSLEVVAFSEEEGVRFGVPFLGSRALAGTVDAQLLARQDAHGITVEQAIREFGLHPDEMENARFDKRTFGYLEFHIEQGPVLDNEKLPLAAVAAIAGQSRLSVIFTGAANHAGTTPMLSRRDALAAAAEWILLVEDFASQSTGLVATVGRLQVSPGAGNVIPGEVRASLDIRHASDSTRTSAKEHLLAKAQRVAHRRGVRFEVRSDMEQNAVPMDSELCAIAERAIAATGQQAKRMVSGAGHDAMILAPVVPSAMIFVRSPGGISHHPDESVLQNDVALALCAGLNFVEELAGTR